MSIDFGAVLLVCGGLFIGLMASVICSVLDNQTVANEVANKVTNKVTNTVPNIVPNIVTETEVYKMACTVDGESYCKEYSVRKINRE